VVLFLAVVSASCWFSIWSSVWLPVAAYGLDHPEYPLMIAACNEEHSTQAGLEQSDCLWSGLYDQSASSARGILCESWLGLYWPSCLMWALSLSWLLEYNFRASLLTWALIVSMPVSSCKISIGVTLDSVVIILNTLFWKIWSLLRCVWLHIPRQEQRK
jgi:hypothetical protein